MVWNKGLSGNPDSPNYDPRLKWCYGKNNPAKRPEVKEKIRQSKLGNKNPMKNPKHVETMIKGLRKLYDSGYKNKNTGRKHTEQERKNMSKGQRRRMKNNPEEWKRTCRKSGLTTHQKHPKQASEMGKATQRKHPNQSREVAIKTNKEWKARDPDDYYKKKKEYCKKMLDKRLKLKKEDPEAYKELYKNAGKNSFQSILDNSPFFWKDVPFLSNQERECAKCILNKPKKGVNCHIRIGRNVIDFYPQQDDKMYQGKLVEFHPYDRKLTPEEYYQQRKEIINNSKHKGTDLIVIKNLEEIKNGIEKEK